ncbi:hypothetical protein KP509_1Z169900 [Ceratopteris richardii]|nr:hypothetical protein KP509_1Z169900 [Ceratopteris richardii]
MVVVCVILGVTLTVVYIKREEVSVNEQSQRYARKFSYKEIKFITRNFENVIGRGAFGLVYEGELRNGLKVAVKKLSKSSTQGKKEFVNEVQFLSRVHHTNLVRLLGYCDESELVLVYEYMVNGSLACCLHGGGVHLRVWKDRLRVAAGAAEGLEYLHRGCDPPIIHRDIKSSNILLNQNFTAKISDFGISKSRKSQALAMTDSSDTVTIVRGTPCYLDPLYEETQVADASVDAYAFGVLLFELVTGRRPIIDGMSGNVRPIHIVQWAKPYIERNQLEGILDPRMCQVVNISSAWKVMEIALMCVDINKNMRPTMGEVRKELESALSMEVPEHSSSAGPLDIPENYGCESIIRPR